MRMVLGIRLVGAIAIAIFTLSGIIAGVALRLTKLLGYGFRRPGCEAEQQY